MTAAQNPGTGRTGRYLLTAVLALLALFPSGYLALRFSDMPQLGIRHDDGIYWVCARSLALDQGYRIASLPAQPNQTKYPPLYAWLLSWIWRARPSFPANLPWATLLAEPQEMVPAAKRMS